LSALADTNAAVRPAIAALAILALLVAGCGSATKVAATPVPLFPKAGQTPVYPQKDREEFVRDCDEQGTDESKSSDCLCLLQQAEARMSHAQFVTEEGRPYESAPRLKVVVSVCLAKRAKAKEAEDRVKATEESEESTLRTNHRLAELVAQAGRRRYVYSPAVRVPLERALHQEVGAAIATCFIRLAETNVSPAEAASVVVALGKHAAHVQPAFEDDEGRCLHADGIGK
jgi:hypothetical protein